MCTHLGTRRVYNVVKRRMEEMRKLNIYSLNINYNRNNKQTACLYLLAVNTHIHHEQPTCAQSYSANKTLRKRIYIRLNILPLLNVLCRASCVGKLLHAFPPRETC